MLSILHGPTMKSTKGSNGLSEVLRVGKVGKKTELDNGNLAQIQGKKFSSKRAIHSSQEPWTHVII